MKEYCKAVYFDVDETLILWHFPTIVQTYYDSQPVEDSIIFIDGLPFKKHQFHLDRLVQHSLTGDMVIVWSSGGTKWATKVIQELELEKFVDYILPKPDFYYDDIGLSKFKSSRMYFNPDTLKIETGND